MASIDSGNGNISFTNHVSFEDAQTGRSRVGHYDLNQKTIQPLAFLSGTPVDNLYQVIEAGELSIVAAGELLPASSTKILPPFTGRDVLCVGKNYAEHAKEFNSSGFDSSDKVDTPSHPVIFTKRFTSIIADGEDIFPHPEFTKTIDYEGEIGVVIGKPGFRISEADALSHVWGYTIINDVTARERQRDHKQFYIGKSPDTFCPMVWKALQYVLTLLIVHRVQSLCPHPSLIKSCGFRRL
jgi:2-keto-4-pentenoate hydratase/2-oxohepta-3-ene-1,7-dioic acid hydratase in catechol pathway